MRLSTEQQTELRNLHGICANEACDTCHSPLNHIRFTRKDQPGEWCSRICRDGIEAAQRYAATRKNSGRRCAYCSLPLPKDSRPDALFCDSTCKRNAARAKEQTQPVLN